MLRVLGLLALCVVAGIAMAGVPSPARALEIKCTSMMDIALSHAVVNHATTESLGAAGKSCRVQVTSKPAPGAEIRVEVWIPVGGAWNGKFVQIGSGGFAGLGRSQALIALATRGYAAASTEYGRQGGDTVWAPKEATDIAKTLIASIKGGPPTRSYFDGCGDGGREALVEAQRFGGDFDGIVAGSPSSPDGAPGDLRGLRGHGGKLVQYSSAADPSAPAHAAIAYYEGLAQTASDTAGFYRLYLVPGAEHCAAAGPGIVDWLSVLDRWSAGDGAPGGIVATAGQGGGAGPLLCPYPQTALPRAGGGGDRCASPAAPTAAKPPPHRRRPRH